MFLTGRKLFAKGFLLDLALWRFLPTGNYSRIVSCSTWHCGVSYRQETVCKWFPTRRGAVVFLADRKLFAYSFLLDLALWRFLPTGNCLQMVSYSTWHCGVSYRQETFREGFPTRRGPIVFLADRKLFAKGFLLGMAPLCFLPAGNFSMGDFSTPLRYARNDRGAWRHGVSYRQETVCEGFPARLGTVVFLTGRKLFAKGFLLDVAPLCFLPTGNFSRRVSYSTWLHCVSYRQETFREGFPARRGTTAFHTGRKLFAKGFLLDVAPLCFLPTGNCLRRVSCSTWLHCVSWRQETFRWEISRLRFATLEMTEGRGGSMFHTVQ